MGVDFNLACGDCCEFIDLHKWQVVYGACHILVHAHYKPNEYPGQLLPEDSPYPFADSDTLCKKIFVKADQIDEALAGDVPDQPYIRELTPIVREFAARHRGHRIFLSCDLGDCEQDPWWPGRPRFADWLEVPGPFRFDWDLPRNLIELKGFESWPAVLIGMANEWPFERAEAHAVEMEAIRAAFEDRRNKNCT